LSIIIAISLHLVFFVLILKSLLFSSSQLLVLIINPIENISPGSFLTVDTLCIALALSSIYLRKPITTHLSKQVGVAALTCDNNFFNRLLTKGWFYFGIKETFKEHGSIEYEH